jgi:predicted transcriptional regulator
VYLTTQLDETQDKHLNKQIPITEKELMKWTGIKTRDTISECRLQLEYFGLIQLATAPSSKGGECYVYTVVEITNEIEQRLSYENYDSAKVNLEIKQMKSLVVKKKEKKRKEKEWEEF